MDQYITELGGQRDGVGRRLVVRNGRHRPRTAAQARWRAITGARLVSLVRVGARFENGVLVEREEQAA
ncbi:hypothetical protein [Streptomyces pseudovenezuelae]|uniref:hypothetical protein n=1 Tax=Streptomyces pseudovenezuelae TaxID=67350 RepID=UPI0039A51ABC